MAINNEEFFKQIVETVDIVETMKKYVDVSPIDTEDGVEYYETSCPFKYDCGSTMVVCVKTKSFYCFSCGAHGNVIDFVAKLGNMNKLTAARFMGNVNKLEASTEAKIGEVYGEHEEQANL